MMRVERAHSDRPHFAPNSRHHNQSAPNASSMFALEQTCEVAGTEITVAGSAPPPPIAGKGLLAQYGKQTSDM
jgi:hypothetical protein